MLKFQQNLSNQTTLEAGFDGNIMASIYQMIQRKMLQSVILQAAII